MKRIDDDDDDEDDVVEIAKRLVNEGTNEARLTKTDFEQRSANVPTSNSPPVSARRNAFRGSLPLRTAICS